MKTNQELFLSGTYREDRHGNKVTMKKGEDIPKTPAHLTEEEAAVFEHIARLMNDNDVLSHLDTFALEVYCVNLILFRKAKKELETNGEYVVVHTNKSGASNHVPSAWLSVLKNTSDILLKVGAKLGLSPIDRNKASKVDKTPEYDYSLFK